jgi:hypothetical protein
MKWKGCGRKRTWPYLRAYSGTCLERLGTTTKTQDGWSLGGDLKPGHTEYEAGMIATRPPQ